MPVTASRGFREHRKQNLVRLGISPERWDILVGLAGNPNTGKTTVFNQLTGLRQHTGNWPGKTVVRAEGAFVHRGDRIKVVDLPGSYSLLAGSTDEEVARDFILFGRPDVVVVVVDATRLERNLNLVLQVLEITERVVVCLNLIDEARRHGISVDPTRLSRELGVPVIPTIARSGEGIEELLDTVRDVARGDLPVHPFRIERYASEVEAAVSELLPAIERAYPGVPNARWVALRLLNADSSVIEAVRSGELGATSEALPDARDALLEEASRLRWQLPRDFHDKLTERIYEAAKTIAQRSESRGLKRAAFNFDRRLDKLITGRWTGGPIMLVLLALVFWITIAGANVPSRMLATGLIEHGHPWLQGLAGTLRAPSWLSGILVDGVYLATAWVVSVMLPPMAIFFPLFTLLEDFGYLPRVAFNMDSLFRRVGAHGKQALTMTMGFGCNAAGVVSTRIIDSPRERLIAILTNNFSLCNGRWPTQILLATIFVGALAPAHLAGLISAGAVVGVAVLGMVFMLATSWLLSHTILRGEATTFSLELPPYRPPRIMQTLYTSVIDRTLIVLWRAVVFAAPAGAVIWLISNVSWGGASAAQHVIGWMNPFGILIGLNGVILLAYVVAIPANEIVIPTILMLTVLAAGLANVGAGAGVMFELESANAMHDVLVAGGWTLLTAVNVMLFSLLHNPCSTTLYTIYKETGSAKWTTIAALLPVLMGFAVCLVVAQVWRLIG